MLHIYTMCGIFYLLEILTLGYVLTSNIRKTLLTLCLTRALSSPFGLQRVKKDKMKGKNKQKEKKSSRKDQEKKSRQIG